MQRPPSSQPLIEKPAAPEFGLGGLPDRLAWPLAALAILGMAVLAWLGIIGVVLRAVGAR
jgi:hypothetical protein